MKVEIETRFNVGDTVWRKNLVTNEAYQVKISRLDVYFFAGEGNICACGQIDRELAAFRDHYENLEPSCLIVYERTAYKETEGDLRLTIDENPRYRMDSLNLADLDKGTLLLPPGHTILEIKVQEAVPLWLAEIISAGRIAKSSFSKYGEAYCRETFPARTA